jgi:hypothetical protein
MEELLSLNEEFKIFETSTIKNKKIITVSLSMREMKSGE